MVNSCLRIIKLLIKIVIEKCVNFRENLTLIFISNICSLILKILYILFWIIKLYF